MGGLIWYRPEMPRLPTVRSRDELQGRENIPDELPELIREGARKLIAEELKAEAKPQHASGGTINHLPKSQFPCVIVGALGADSTGPFDAESLVPGATKL